MPSSFAGAPSVPLPVPGESGQALLVALRGRGTLIAGEAVQHTLLGQQPTAVPRGGGEDTGSRPSAPVAAAATPPSSTSPRRRGS